jgi:hypothetical protein
MVAHTCNPTQQAESEGAQVWGQPRLHNEFLGYTERHSQKNPNKSLKNADYVPNCCLITNDNKTLIFPLIKKKTSQGTVTTACNPSYSGGRDQGDRSLKPVWANSLRDPFSKEPEGVVAHTYNSSTPEEKAVRSLLPGQPELGNKTLF